MFTDSTVLFASGIIWNNVQIKGMADPSYDATKVVVEMNEINIVLPRITYVLGDMIVVWRAWIIHEEGSWFRVALAVCAMISATVSIVDAVLSSLNNSASVIFANASLTFEMMLPASLLFTNFIATSTIGYKTWVYRKFIKIHLEDSYKHNNGFKVEQILIILLESGIVYCFLWILVIVTKTSSVIQASYQVGAYVGILMPHAASMYPTTIVLLTALQMTYCDTTLKGDFSQHGEEGRGRRSRPSNFTMSLRFGEAARSPSASTIDIAIEPSREMESRGSREMDEVDDGIGTRSPQAGKNLDMIECICKGDENV
ncbi:hypothetical protein D9758_015094 [Tetrapyrgos nigripes]|uniref:Uncharacterized protein n=1 Tax=Tetrapyrgos nigripes TaxID=182062 RepID=A0A8H5C8W8_9AGAR|nr:hypothetical protein D9758_015094 [Tetrapyrgos nigripes]